MLVAILREHGLRVFTNPTGSNFTRGVISSMLGQIPLSGRLRADMAVLELDEAHALRFAAQGRPTHSLLLNVARDQLDRFAEIDATPQLLAPPSEQTTRGVVLNIDDSFISRGRDRIAEASTCATSASTPRSLTGCRSCRRPTSASRTTSPHRSRAPGTGCSSPVTSGPSRCSSAR